MKTAKPKDKTTPIWSPGCPKPLQTPKQPKNTKVAVPII